MYCSEETYQGIVYGLREMRCRKVRLSNQYASIVNRELVNLPEEGTNGERGRSRVQLSVTKDGTLRFLGSILIVPCAEDEENKLERNR